MTLLLRTGGAVALALMFAAGGLANAGTLVWSVNHDEVSAVVGVADSDDLASGEPTYRFSMECSADGDETTIVSDIDPKALGKAIANGDIPTFNFVVDGKTDEETGGEVADLRYDQMAGVWQYIVNGADASPLVDAKTIRVEGAGIGLDLPKDKMAASLKTFKDACDAFEAANEAGEEDDSGQ